jgi:hypothetical protein
MHILVVARPPHSERRAVSFAMIDAADLPDDGMAMCRACRRMLLFFIGLAAVLHRGRRRSRSDPGCPLR